ncbi:response regulator [Lachnoclostridium pacaense]|uniref:response regulator transcription factor n=1 Tax=Enterocloster hominis (ex Hitch et al. 2024) TaxID=1917870 RepID=UPI001D1234BC|nr:response regulator [Lachnoclostridium pacaense]MCC2817653.1 response regulator [Lachnoclostridium pacaense]
MRILIADDEMISRATIQRMIRNYCPWAGQVKEASDGREAVEKAMELDADVVLMDIEMPELDGMEAARRLRQWKEGCVIIFLTAFATFQYAKQAISLGATEFLVKPVDPCELKKVLERVRERVDGTAGGMGRTAEDRNPAYGNRARVEGAGVRAEGAGVRAGGAGGHVSGAGIHISDSGSHTLDEAIKSFGARAVKISQEGKQYMDLHYMDDIGVDTMARMFQVSANYFNKMFKQAYSISSKEYLINIRVGHAMEYLKNPALTIREAGIMVGYEDSNYFTRIFKKKTGMTPIEYRNKCFFQPDGVQGEQIR